MKKYVTLVAFICLAFLVLLFSSLFEMHMREELSESFFDYHKYVFSFWWLPYIFMIISGLLLYGAVSVIGNGEGELLAIAVLNLIAGISIAGFTVLTIKMVILESTMFPVCWSEVGAKPSMVLAGVCLMNGFKSFRKFRTVKKAEGIQE